jgi:hypothetical protein
MPFPKGISGNPGGRPKGRPNNATVEIRALAQSLFDKTYWERVRARLIEGTLHPSIEAKLLEYAYGEPKQEGSDRKVVVNLGFLAALEKGGARCLVPQCGGGTIDATTKETLWDRYFTEAPRPLTPSEQQYSDRRLRSRR